LGFIHDNFHSVLFSVAIVAVMIW